MTIVNIALSFFQCYDRAMEIWDSMEAIEEESTKRKILNAKAKSKKYEKKMAGQYVMSWQIDSQLASFISVFMAKFNLLTKYDYTRLNCCH